MKTSDAIQFYGGTKMALSKALGVSPSAITQWGEDIPLLRQYQIERLTKGKLKADPVAA